MPRRIDIKEKIIWSTYLTGVFSTLCEVYFNFRCWMDVHTTELLLDCEKTFKHADMFPSLDQMQELEVWVVIK